MAQDTRPQEHTYCIEHDGETYRHTTTRTYTHAAILYRNTRPTADGRRDVCAPYVAQVYFARSAAEARCTHQPWHWKAVIVELGSC